MKTMKKILSLIVVISFLTTNFSFAADDSSFKLSPPSKFIHFQGPEFKEAAQVIAGVRSALKELDGFNIESLRALGAREIIEDSIFRSKVKGQIFFGQAEEAEVSGRNIFTERGGYLITASAGHGDYFCLISKSENGQGFNVSITSSRIMQEALKEGAVKFTHESVSEEDKSVLETYLEHEISTENNETIDPFIKKNMLNGNYAVDSERSTTDPLYRDASPDGYQKINLTRLLLELGLDFEALGLVNAKKIIDTISSKALVFIPYENESELPRIHINEEEVIVKAHSSEFATYIFVKKDIYREIIGGRDWLNLIKAYIAKELVHEIGARCGLMVTVEDGRTHNVLDEAYKNYVDAGRPKVFEFSTDIANAVKNIATVNLLELELRNDYAAGEKGKKGIFKRTMALILSRVSSKFASKKTANLSFSPTMTSDFQSISREIGKLVKGLEYSDKVAEDFIKIVSAWKDAEGQSVLFVWKQMLGQAREEYKLGRITKDNLVKIEEEILKELGHKIRKEVRVASIFEESLDLAEAIKRGQCNCLGYSQIVYILGHYVGLNVQTIDVAELVNKGQLPAEALHIACVVHLIDNRAMTLDLAVGPNISDPFMLKKDFKKMGNYWVLKHQNNSLRAYRRFQLLDEDGILAIQYNNRGVAYGKLGRFNQALSCLKKAIKLNPKCAIAYHNLGNIYVHLDRYKEAIDSYTKAIKLNPKCAMAYNNRGNAYDEIGRYGQAIADYSKAIEINPNYTAARNNMNTVLTKLKRHDRTIRGEAAVIAKQHGATKKRKRELAKTASNETPKADVNKAKMLILQKILVTAPNFIDSYKTNPTIILAVLDEATRMLQQYGDFDIKCYPDRIEIMPPKKGTSATLRSVNPFAILGGIAVLGWGVTSVKGFIFSQPVLATVVIVGMVAISSIVSVKLLKLKLRNDYAAGAKEKKSIFTRAMSLLLAALMPFGCEPSEKKDERGLIPLTQQEIEAEPARAKKEQAATDELIHELGNERKLLGDFSTVTDKMQEERRKGMLFRSGVKQESVQSEEEQDIQQKSIEEQIEELIERLSAKDPQVAKNVIEGLAKIGEPAVASLVEAMKKEDRNISLKSSMALVAIGEPAINSVIDLLKDKNEYIRGYAELTLVKIGKPAINPLADALKNQDTTLSMAASITLCKIGEPAVKSLIDALNCKDEHVITNTISALGVIGSDQAIKPLIEVLEGGDKKINGLVWWAMKKIGKSAVQPLVEALSNENQYVRIYAALILGDIGDSSVSELLKKVLEVERNSEVQRVIKQTIEKIQKTTSGSGEREGESEGVSMLDLAPAVRDAGVLSPAALLLTQVAMSQIPNKAIDQKSTLTPVKDVDLNKRMEKLINDLDPSRVQGVRAMAALELGHFKHPEAVKALVQALKDDVDVDVRILAALSLADIKDPSTVKILTQITETDKSSIIRKAAAGTLEAIQAALEPDSIHKTNKLIKKLINENVFIRLAVVEALGNSKDTEAVEPLMQALQYDTKVVREIAAWALGNIGDPRAIEVLVKALEHDHEGTVSANASVALRRIKHPKIVERLIEDLKHYNLLTYKTTTNAARLAIITCLGNMGYEAKDALFELRKISERDIYEIVRNSAKEAVEKIEKAQEEAEKPDSGDRESEREDMSMLEKEVSIPDRAAMYELGRADKDLWMWNAEHDLLLDKMVDVLWLSGTKMISEKEARARLAALAPRVNDETRNAWLELAASAILAMGITPVGKHAKPEDLDIKAIAARIKELGIEVFIRSSEVPNSGDKKVVRQTLERIFGDRVRYYDDLAHLKSLNIENPEKAIVMTVGLEKDDLDILDSMDDQIRFMNFDETNIEKMSAVEHESYIAETLSILLVARAITPEEAKDEFSLHYQMLAHLLEGHIAEGELPKYISRIANNKIPLRQRLVYVIHNALKAVPAAAYKIIKPAVQVLWSA